MLVAYAIMLLSARYCCVRYAYATLRAMPRQMPLRYATLSALLALCRAAVLLPRCAADVCHYAAMMLLPCARRALRAAPRYATPWQLRAVAMARCCRAVALLAMPA